jgi:hypothetical protein
MDTIKRLATCLVFIAALTGCGNRVVQEDEEGGRTNVPVTVAQIRSSTMTSYAEFNASSSFLVRAVIKAPVAGYIDQVKITQGQQVEQNQVMFILKTKESAALEQDTTGNMDFRGIVTIRASLAGTVLRVEHPKGDYISEGDLLCEIADQSSLVFFLDVPFELSRVIRLNSSCGIILPDNRTLRGEVTLRMPLMGSSAQTERFLVKLSDPANLPENLVARVRVVKEVIPAAVALPQSCILADETLQHFWVMKLINDSTAIKVPITPGITQDGFVQVTSPVLLPSERFLSSGNYGLADTASVKIINSGLNE